MKFDDVLRIGQLGFKILNGFWKELLLIQTNDPVQQALLKELKKNYGLIIADYKVALAQKRNDTRIKKSILNEKIIRRTITGLRELARLRPELNGKINVIINYILQIPIS